MAAIAVPNFLEAQMRAKVSRTKSDMRTMATAIEAYSVDWNRPMMGQGEIWRQQCNSGYQQYVPLDENTRVVAAWSKLTTPVAYVASILPDVFGRASQKDSMVYAYACQSFVGCLSDPSVSSDHAKAYALGYTWATASRGPTRSAAGNLARFLWGGNPAITKYAYDPSNGTVSYGEIVRTNKGEYRSPGN
ncbi:MAG: hypothetical protein NTW86_04005 [Candidatus Sumerlaeota bacterium]|nr:hypothetical protein [Candidatus Sumerlaeota bacterium]